MEDNARCIISAQLIGDTIATTTITDGMMFPLLSVLKGVGKHQR